MDRFLGRHTFTTALGKYQEAYGKDHKARICYFSISLVSALIIMFLRTLICSPFLIA